MEAWFSAFDARRWSVLGADPGAAETWSSIGFDLVWPRPGTLRASSQRWHAARRRAAAGIVPREIRPDRQWSTLRCSSRETRTGECSRPPLGVETSFRSGRPDGRPFHAIPSTATAEYDGAATAPQASITQVVTATMASTSAVSWRRRSSSASSRVRPAFAIRSSSIAKPGLTVARR
jgi:hypothetical protein